MQLGMLMASMSEQDETHVQAAKPEVHENLAGMMDEMNPRGGA